MFTFILCNSGGKTPLWSASPRALLQIWFVGPYCGACQAADASWAAGAALNAGTFCSASHRSRVLSKPMFPGRVSWISNTSSFPTELCWMEWWPFAAEEKESALVTGKGLPSCSPVPWVCAVTQGGHRLVSGSQLASDRAPFCLSSPVSEHLQHNSIQLMLKKNFTDEKKILFFLGF